MRLQAGRLRLDAPLVLILIQPHLCRVHDVSQPSLSCVVSPRLVLGLHKKRIRVSAPSLIVAVCVSARRANLLVSRPLLASCETRRCCRRLLVRWQLISSK